MMWRLCVCVCALHTHDTWLHDSHFPVGWEYTAQIGYVLVFYLKSSLMFNIDQN